MAPERTCVGCRKKRERHALLRLVRTDGRVRVDPQGTAPGRGAYVDREAGCVDAALRPGAIARTLRISLAPPDLARLRKDIEREMSV